MTMNILDKLWETVDRCMCMFLTLVIMFFFTETGIFLTCLKVPRIQIMAKIFNNRRIWPKIFIADWRIHTHLFTYLVWFSRECLEDEVANSDSREIRHRVCSQEKKSWCTESTSTCQRKGNAAGRMERRETIPTDNLKSTLGARGNFFRVRARERKRTAAKPRHWDAKRRENCRCGYLLIFIFIFWRQGTWNHAIETHMRDLKQAK